MKIGSRDLEIPIIQGGMGVGISLGGLAGSVAQCGGMGIISTADTGFRDQDFWKNNKSFNKANEIALKKEIEKAKKIANGRGLIGINAMVATSNYKETVTFAVKNGIDTIISGAGVPLRLPEITKGSGVALAPIVSSGKAAKTILKFWNKKYGIRPDFIVVEGPEAGGHLGFRAKDLEEGRTEKLEDILMAVLKEIRTYEEAYNEKIPVFAAGGIFTSKDIKKMLGLGASGVQMATRFIATHECDASQDYKEMYINLNKEDIQLVQSPVGMPGRALKTALLERLKKGRIKPKRCVDCLLTCDPSKTPYCISKALIQAWQGDNDNGLFFSGSQAYRLEKIVSVKELIDELLSEL